MNLRTTHDNDSLISILATMFWDLGSLPSSALSPHHYFPLTHETEDLYPHIRKLLSSTHFNDKNPYNLPCMSNLENPKSYCWH